jgi:hypothetical protein
MGIKRSWVIEEMVVDDQVAHRQTAMESDDITGELIRPDSRLGAAGQREWDHVMKQLSDVGGRDLRHVISGVALMDHCLAVQKGRL